MENLRKILPIIAENIKEIKLYNTICSATSNRQQEAVALAREVDLMVVAGSRSSANTTHLAEVLSELTPTIHIETKDDLEYSIEQINSAISIGITAGASTPEYVINDVIKRIGEINT